jgi:hypothetical protein
MHSLWIFFKFFYELIKNDLLLTVRESQRMGKVIGTFNSTFLFIIPKSQDGTTFGDFRTISFCDVTYKIISKVIVKHLKPLLSEFINKEKI